MWKTDVKRLEWKLEYSKFSLFLSSKNNKYQILTTNPNCVVPIENGGTNAKNKLSASLNLEFLSSSREYTSIADTQNI